MKFERYSFIGSMGCEFPINPDNFYIPTLGRDPNYAKAEGMLYFRQITPKSIYELLAGTTETFAKEELETKHFDLGLGAKPPQRTYSTTHIVWPLAYGLDPHEKPKADVIFELQRRSGINNMERDEHAFVTFRDNINNVTKIDQHKFTRDVNGTVNYELKHIIKDDKKRIEKLVPLNTEERLLSMLEICGIAREALIYRPESAF